MGVHSVVAAAGYPRLVSGFSVEPAQRPHTKARIQPRFKEPTKQFQVLFDVWQECQPTDEPFTIVITSSDVWTATKYTAVPIVCLYSFPRWVKKKPFLLFTEWSEISALILRSSFHLRVSLSVFFSFYLTIKILTDCHDFFHDRSLFVGQAMYIRGFLF